MKKIPALFKCIYEHGKKPIITKEVTAGCEWVTAGEGKAYFKFDGTACLVKDGKLFARYDAKKGKIPPQGAIPCQEPDLVTGHWPHWVQVTSENPAYKYHWAAFKTYNEIMKIEDGTYELCGPHFQANPHNLDHDSFFPHIGQSLIVNVPDRSFESIKKILEALNFEGLVFHHPDGRMAKIRRDHFGLDWPIV
jgi:hypothetical protein